MVAEARTASPQQRRRRPVLQLAAGLGATVVVVLVLVVPVLTMLLLQPRGFPTPLPGWLALVLLALAGVVIGLTVRAARSRPLLAVTAAVTTLVLALWFQAGLWWTADWTPAPPILPNVPPTLALVAGALLATALAAVTGAARSRRDVPADRGTSVWSASTVLLGAVAAAAVVTVVEADVWGRRLLQQTLEGPWGLGRFSWLALLFAGLLVAGALVGWVVITVRHAPPAPTVAVALVAAAVLLVWVVADLDGPPRSTLYGLSLGLLATAALASGAVARRPAQDAG